MQPFDLSIVDAAIVLDSAMYIVGTLEAACVADRAPSENLPAGLVTCGEALLLFPALAVLVLQRYPQLIDDETLSQTLQMAVLASVGGEPN